ncbi:hypothetical protein BGZ98_005362, partial [Dissophora globulifera]
DNSEPEGHDVYDDALDGEPGPSNFQPQTSKHGNSRARRASAPAAKPSNPPAPASIHMPTRVNPPSLTGDTLVDSASQRSGNSMVRAMETMSTKRTLSEKMHYEDRADTRAFQRELIAFQNAKMKHDADVAAATAAATAAAAAAAVTAAAVAAAAASATAAAATAELQAQLTASQLQSFTSQTPITLTFTMNRTTATLALRMATPGIALPARKVTSTSHQTAASRQTMTPRKTPTPRKTAAPWKTAAPPKASAPRKAAPAPRIVAAPMPTLNSPETATDAKKNVPTSSSLQANATTQRPRPSQGETIPSELDGQVLTESNLRLLEEQQEQQQPSHRPAEPFHNPEVEPVLRVGDKIRLSVSETMEEVYCIAANRIVSGGKRKAEEDSSSPSSSSAEDDSERVAKHRRQANGKIITNDSRDSRENVIKETRKLVEARTELLRMQVMKQIV